MNIRISLEDKQRYINLIWAFFAITNPFSHEKNEFILTSDDGAYSLLIRTEVNYVAFGHTSTMEDPELWTANISQGQIQALFCHFLWGRYDDLRAFAWASKDYVVDLEGELTQKESDKFDQHTIKLYADEEGVWIARFAERPSISAFGDTPEQAIQELGIVWEQAKECYRKNNSPYPGGPAPYEREGNLSIRINRPLYWALAKEAAEARLSVNEIIIRKLAG